MQRLTALHTSLRVLTLTLGLIWCHASAAAPANPAEPRLFAVWVEPLPLLTTAIGYSGFPVGSNIAIGPRSDVVVEVMPFLIRDSCDSVCGGRGLFVAVGMAFQLTGGPTRDGLFLQPKLIGHVARNSYIAGRHPNYWRSKEDEASLAIGADIGYRMTIGSLFLSPVLGVSAGYLQGGEHNNYPRFITGERVPASRWGYDINVHLLRLGLSF